jgi:mono/diheme cytochrome c family protein
MIIGNILIILVLVTIVALFVWLARRAWRIRQPVARWALTIQAALPALLFTLVVGFILYGYYQVYGPRSVPVPSTTVVATPQQVARGAHLSLTVCAPCYGTDGQLPMSGGRDIATDSPLPIGTLVPPNLTPAGPLQSWSDGEIMRAIRDGVQQNGRTLLMPTQNLRNLSDEDVTAIIAYLRSQPAMQNETTPTNISPVLAFFFGTGLAGQVHYPPVTAPVDAPPKAPTAEYGAYIVSYNDCRSCHGADLNGSTGGGLAPPAPNARAIVAGWTREQFIQAMRTGVDPSGHTIQPPMPWKAIGRMDDEELTALYTYLRSLQVAPK